MSGRSVIETKGGNNEPLKEWKG
ncbi:hypothetical protein [Pseudomonas sp. P1.8]